MKHIILLPLILIWGCTPTTPEEIEEGCIAGLDAHKCFPESHMQVVYEITNTTDNRVLLGNPLEAAPEYYPEGEGEIPHDNIELKHLDNSYFSVPGNETRQYFRSSRMDIASTGQFSASILFTDDVLECLSDEAYQESAFTGEVTYNLSPDNTVTCSEEQLISLLINYFRITEENFDSLSEQEVGRPFILTSTDEVVPFEAQEGTYRRVTYHYRVLQSQ